MIKSYKGFDKDLKCRNMQYEVGKEYEAKGNISCCNNGLHSCEFPFDVFNFYKPGESRYCEVEAFGNIDKDSDCTKIAASKMKINVEIGLKGLIESAVNFIFEKVKISKETSATTGYNANSATTGYNANSATTGDYANSATTGDYANSATTGDYANSATTGYNANSATTGDNANSATTGYNANSATTGDYANSEVNGKESIAVGIGKNNKAKGALGCWIVLSEWVQDENYEWHINTVKAVKVDGKKIKADTWYHLKDKKFTEFTE